MGISRPKSAERFSDTHGLKINGLYFTIILCFVLFLPDCWAGQAPLTQYTSVAPVWSVPSVQTSRERLELL